MKILFLFPHFTLPGGAANSTIRFARALQERGHATEIICAQADQETLRSNSDLRFTALNIPTSGSFWYWIFFPFWQLKIHRWLRKYRGYIFFPQVFPSNWWAWIFKANHPKTRIIWNCNEPSAFIHSAKWIDAIRNPLMRLGATLLNPLLKALDCQLEKQNDVVFCNSHYSAAEYEKAYRRKPWGVIYPPSYIVQAPLIEKKDYFFTVSRLTRFKNVDRLIRAFREISPRFPSYRLLIAGEGEEKENLEKIALAEGLKDRVVFMGKVSDQELPALYGEARATVFCSENEPFGLVPVESMMYGTPVIAHRSGGPAETIPHDQAGFLYDDPSQIPRFMSKIISLDASGYRRLQEACRKQALSFDISQSIARLETILKAI